MSIFNIEQLVLMPIDEWYGVTTDIPIQLIKPDPENLRKEFDEDDLVDLGKNIESIGQLDEITVFPILDETSKWAGFFDLHDGERRWRAASLVGIPSLRAKIVTRPSNNELLFKRISRVLQTRTLLPEKKVTGLERVLSDLGVLGKPETWESLREKLGGGPEWPQLIRVLLLKPKVRKMMDEGLINFTIAQSIGRLPDNRQAELAEYIVVNKINGRFFSTQMVPYLLEYPDASPAQAFEHTRVGNWKQYTKSPYQRGEEPPLNERIESFLESCVKWERAWEELVRTGVVFEIRGDSNQEYRMQDAARRIADRANALFEKIQSSSQNPQARIEEKPVSLMENNQRKPEEK